MNIISVPTAYFDKSLDRIVIETQTLLFNFGWYVVACAATAF